MGKDSERQAWTKFVEEREAERKPKRPRAKKRATEEASQAKLEAGLDDLVTRPQTSLCPRWSAGSFVTSFCPRNFGSHRLVAER
jgi:hypothetical protein